LDLNIDDYIDLRSPETKDEGFIPEEVVNNEDYKSTNVVEYSKIKEENSNSTNREEGQLTHSSGEDSIDKGDFEDKEEISLVNTKDLIENIDKTSVEINQYAEESNKEIINTNLSLNEDVQNN